MHREEHAGEQQQELAAGEQQLPAQSPLSQQPEHDATPVRFPAGTARKHFHSWIKCVPRVRIGKIASGAATSEAGSVPERKPAIGRPASIWLKILPGGWASSAAQRGIVTAALAIRTTPGIPFLQCPSDSRFRRRTPIVPPPEAFWNALRLKIL